MRKPVPDVVDARDATASLRSRGIFPGQDVLPDPSADPIALWSLGVHGVPLTQYLRWADDVGLFVAMVDAGDVTVDDVVSRTALTPRGAEAFLGVVCSLHLATRTGERYRLSDVAREFLDRRSRYYQGPSLYGMLHAPLPPQLRAGEPVRRYSQFTGTLRDFVRFLRKPNQMGRREQLMSQHRRNLPMNVAAARTNRFEGISHLVDVGGGSGAFAIPLALAYPSMQVTLLELHRALKHIGPFLEPFGLQDRVKLVGVNVHRTPWPIDGCDGVLFGNFLHFCDDDESLNLLRESCRILAPGGRLFLHEMLWNDAKDGPIATALWNFWMTTISAGRQRTLAEVRELLRQSGFQTISADATLGGFTLIVGRKISEGTWKR